MRLVIQKSKSSSIVFEYTTKSELISDLQKRIATELVDCPHLSYDKDDIALYITTLLMYKSEIIQNIEDVLSLVTHVPADEFSQFVNGQTFWIDLNY